MKTRTRITLAALALGVAGMISGSALAVVPVTGATPTLTPVTINSGPGDQTDPHVSGDWAAYTDNVAIRYYNFSTGVDAQIPLAASSRDLLSDVSGSKIVFSHITASGTAVMVFDAATPAVAPVEIDAAPGTTRFGSAIGGNTVAYIDFGLQSNGELVIHDLATNASTRITTDTAADGNPSVSPDGNVVTWEHCVSLSNCDVWEAVKSGASWTVSAVANSTSPEGNPDSNGTLVAYDAQRGADSDLFWRAVTGGAETQLQMPGFQFNPSIAGHFISFESRSGIRSPDTTDIFVYDLLTNRLFQITDTPLVSEQINDMTLLPDGTVRVVWAVEESLGSGTRDIKAATFRLADTVPPVLTVPANITVNATGPAGAVVTYTATATDNVTLNPTVSCVPASGSTFAVGTTTVNCTATDAAGNSSTGSFTVTVRGSSAQIGDLVDKTLLYLGLPALSAPLKTQLQAAINALVANNKPAACSALQLYIALVSALPASTLTAAQRADLIADATRIRGAIGC
jgi:Tol biopolymer transport system component